MSPIALLCGIIAQSGNVAETTYRDCDGYGDLMAAGLVRRQGLVQSVLCDACDTGHDATILFQDGRYGNLCPEAGFVPVERPDLIAVAADLDELSTQVAAALGCGVRRPRRIANESWHVGTVKTETADIAVYIHPCLRTLQDLSALDAALRRQVRSRFGLVLTACGTLPVPGMTAAPLDQVFGFDRAHGRLVAEADLATIVGAPVARKGGRPATYADRITAIIADRAANGRTETGKNAETRAIQAEYAARFPGDQPPSHSTVGRHLSANPSGS